eukprot:SAG11_NODE_3981_length_2121_cov_536.604847_3_plen_164_part_00
MVNYNNGKIYKIVCNITGLVYVGSTTKPRLSQRLASHVGAYKRYKRGEHDSNYVTSFKVLENNDYDIILLENVNCNCKDELFARERYYFDTIDCVNKMTPGRTHKEWLKTNAIKVKQTTKIYQQKNKEHIHQQKMYRYFFINSWGGDPRSNNNLLKIDVNLFS